MGFGNLPPCYDCHLLAKASQQSPSRYAARPPCQSRHQPGRHRDSPAEIAHADQELPKGRCDASLAYQGCNPLSKLLKWRPVTFRIHELLRGKLNGCVNAVIPANQHHWRSVNRTQRCPWAVEFAVRAYPPITQEAIIGGSNSRAFLIEDASWSREPGA